MSFATHLPFPSPPSALAPSQVSSSPSTPTPGRPSTGGGCCENGRPVLTDPTTGQSVCSCQYSSALLGYSRLPGLSGSLFSPSSYSPGAPPAPTGYGVGLGAEGSAFYSPLGGPGTNMRDSTDAWRSLTQTTLYDTSPMGFYPYGGYGGLDLNARRKNATRESTNTLKAWLHEHIKNPYPTKGEKIMLAIITKMTLTQVSTWFANARRRLKKENKMTWSPRNRSEDGDDDDDDDEGGPAGDDGSGMKVGDKDQEKERRLNNNGDDVDVDGISNKTTTTASHLAGTKYHPLTSPIKPLTGGPDSVSPTPSIAEDARSRLSPRDSDSSTYPALSEGGYHPHPHPLPGHTTDLEADQQKPKIWSVTDFLHPGATSSSKGQEPSSCKETGMKMDVMRCVPTSAEAAAAAAAVDLTGRTVSVAGSAGSVGVGVGVGGVTSAAAVHAHAAALSAARGTAAGFFPPMTSLSPAQQLTSYQSALASYAAHSSGYGPYGGLGAMDVNKLVMKPTATRFSPYNVGSKPVMSLADSAFPPARDFSVLREGE